MHIKSFLIATLVAVAPFSGVFAGGGDPAYTVSASQMQSYQQQLFDEVKKQEQFVAYLQNEMARTDTVKMGADTARYENAVTMLDVKRSLVSNFIGTQSLQSQAVRNMLLSILKQELIQPSDLAALQNLVNAEKAKIQSMNNPGATGSTVPGSTTPSTPTTPTTPLPVPVPIPGPQ